MAKTEVTTNATITAGVQFILFPPKPPQAPKLSRETTPIWTSVRSWASIVLLASLTARICRAKKRAQQRTSRSPLPGRNVPSSEIKPNPAAANPAPVKTVQLGNLLSKKATIKGTKITFSPVIKAALLGVVHSKPSVCKA